MVVIFAIKSLVFPQNYFLLNIIACQLNKILDMVHLKHLKLIQLELNLWFKKKKLKTCSITMLKAK